MATVKTGFLQPYMGYLQIDGSTVLCVKNISLSTPRSSSSQQYIGSPSAFAVFGNYEWSASFESDQILTQDISVGEASYDQIMRAHLAKKQLSCLFKMSHADISTGQFYLGGTAGIENVEWNFTSGENPATFTTSLKGIGGLTTYPS